MYFFQLLDSDNENYGLVFTKTTKTEEKAIEAIQKNFTKWYKDSFDDEDVINEPYDLGDVDAFVEWHNQNSEIKIERFYVNQIKP